VLSAACVAVCTPPPRPRKALEPFVLLLSPYAPHLAEELWSRLGHSASLAYEAWPEADESLLVVDAIKLPVQVCFFFGGEGGRVAVCFEGGGRRGAVFCVGEGGRLKLCTTAALGRGATAAAWRMRPGLRLMSHCWWWVPSSCLCSCVCIQE
jgi:hypothetical protein